MIWVVCIRYYGVLCTNTTSNTKKRVSTSLLSLTDSVPSVWRELPNTIKMRALALISRNVKSIWEFDVVEKYTLMLRLIRTRKLWFVGDSSYTETAPVYGSAETGYRLTDINIADEDFQQSFNITPTTINSYFAPARVSTLKVIQFTHSLRTSNAIQLRWQRIKTTNLAKWHHPQSLPKSHRVILPKRHAYAGVSRTARWRFQRTAGSR